MGRASRGRGNGRSRSNGGGQSNGGGTGPPTRDPFEFYARLRRVRAFVLSHLRESLPLKRVAAVASLSPSYFSSYFRERVGTPYTRWLAVIRFERVARLLRTTDLPITKIAPLVGFPSLRSLERWFRKLDGRTPLEFREIYEPRRRRVLK